MNCKFLKFLMHIFQLVLIILVAQEKSAVDTNLPLTI